MKVNGTNSTGIDIKLVPALGKRVIGTGIAEEVTLLRLVLSTVRLLYYDDKPMTNVGKRHETPRTEQPLPRTLHPFHPFFPFVFFFFPHSQPTDLFLRLSRFDDRQQPAISAGGSSRFLQRPKAH